ncbi:MAG: PAS domain S-box protein [Limisphaerales bacterium]
MAKELRILILEDVAADVVLINHELRKGGLAFRSRRVDNRAAFLHELQHAPPDLILSDHGLPGFDGFTALALARQQCPDVPFIFVTGSLGEEVVIETLKCGATDYVLKDRLATNLVRSVRQALHAAEEHVKRKLAEQALHESEERFRLLVEGVKDYAMCMLDPEGRVMSWNAGAEWIMGYLATEIIGQSYTCFYTPEDVKRGKAEQGLKAAAAEGRHEEEGWRVRKGGARFVADVIITALRDPAGNLGGFAHVTRDVSERKQAQEELQKSEVRYRRLVELCPDALLVQSKSEILFVNDAATRLLGAAEAGQLVGKPMKDVVEPEHWEPLREHLRRLREEGTTFFMKRTRKARDTKAPAAFNEAQLVRLDGTRVDVVIAAAPLTFQDRPAVMVIAHDITERKITQVALQQSEARKSAILETALDAIVSIDHQGVFHEWNPAAEKIFGYRRADALGRPMDELIIPPSLRETYRQGLADYLITGVGSLLGRPIELTAMRADGGEFPAEAAITRVPHSEPPVFTCFIRDITERKKAEEELRLSEERFRLLVEGVVDYGIYLLDPAGHVASWTTGAERVEGYQASEILGRHYSCFFTPEDQEKQKPATELLVAATEGRAQDEGWRVRKDGSQYWSYAVLTALRDAHGNLYGFSKVVRDLTERKRAEEEIQRLNADLEQRVIQRTAQLEAANKELEAFSYSVSHDLRAPLRHIDGFIDILHRNVGASLSDENRALLRTISTSARQMGKLIDALLAFARIGRGDVNKTRVSLAQLVTSALHDLRPETEGRNLEWAVSGTLPTVDGDPALLRQVLVNLLSNALKYTRPRASPRIEISSTNTAGETVVYIRDNGIGFDMNYADKLFGVFQRLHRSEEFEGTGIGLANVRRIIERHGGKVWAEGAVDGGATFYFSLPRKEPEDVHEPDESDSRSRR